MIGVVTLLYGLAMAAGGTADWRRVGSVPSLIGGIAVGALAVIGGAMLLGGNETGRGIALLGSVFACLFFGWSLSSAVRGEGRPVTRPVILLTVSLVISVLLVTTR